MNVFSATFTGMAKLDGALLGYNLDGRRSEACPNMGIGPCPWFANGKRFIFLCHKHVRSLHSDWVFMEFLRLGS